MGFVISDGPEQTEGFAEIDGVVDGKELGMEEVLGWKLVEGFAVNDGREETEGTVDIVGEIDGKDVVDGMKLGTEKGLGRGLTEGFAVSDKPKASWILMVNLMA